MLIFTAETDKPVVGSWRNVFVFGDRCIERVDTQELVQPMELDREEARKERNRVRRAHYAKNADVEKAKSKAYNAANADVQKAYQKAYNAANADVKKAYQKVYNAKNADVKKAYQKVYNAKNADVQKAYQKVYKAKNADVMKAKRKVYNAKNADVRNANYALNIDKIKQYRREKYGCVDCKDWPDWQYGSKRYDGRCPRCHKHKFPDDPRLRAEDAVRAYINANFKDFVHDHKMPTAHCVCDHRRRIDHRCVVGNTLLCIETDEHWHKNYDPDDEDARYHDVMMGHGGKLCFVRFNPDRFSPDDEGPPLEERLERLHAEITRHIGRLERGENNSLLEVWYLYYPEGTPDFYDENTSPYLQEDYEESAPEGQ